MYLIYSNIEGFYFCVGLVLPSCLLFFLRKAMLCITTKEKKIKNHVVHTCLKMRTEVWTQITLDLFSGGFRYWPLLLSFSNVFQNAFLLSWLSKSKKLIILGSICDTPLPNWYISGLKKKEKVMCIVFLLLNCLSPARGVFFRWSLIYLYGCSDFHMNTVVYFPIFLWRFSAYMQLAVEKL